MKILIIEDNEQTIKAIKDFVEDEGNECKCVDFENAQQNIAGFNPDMIVMDWMYDAGEINKGMHIFTDMYTNAFRPVLIFSAVAETIDLPEDVQKNPLIEVIPKGDEEIVIEKIRSWIPYINAVSELKKEFNNSLLVSVLAIGNFMNMTEYPGDEVVKYMLNKRTTYYFDKEYIGEQPPAWIQYEYPPVMEHLVVADILRCNSEGIDVNLEGCPEEYLVVLTPSCDLARAKMTDTLLVAKCEGKENYSNIKLKKGESITSRDGENKKKEIIKSLNQGYNNAKVALPYLPNKVPYCTINLKKIETILLAEVGLSEDDIEGHKYYRVASIVSPFREQIVWAHMNNSCRPGMPVRNMDSWAEGILS